MADDIRLSHGIRLRRYLFECPRAWINFVHYANPEMTIEGEPRVDEILLAEHRGIYSESWVQFENLEDLTEFLLRWG